MSRILIRGLAAVFQEEEQIVDPAILRSLRNLVYDDERFTDYLAGPEEDDIATALEPGGVIKFDYHEGRTLLVAETEYRSNRPLTNRELQLLVAYTMGQWSDGIGENWTGESADRCGYTIMCLTSGDGIPEEYPMVQVIET